jgi:hypothetical protein
LPRTEWDLVVSRPKWPGSGRSGQENKWFRPRMGGSGWKKKKEKKKRRKIKFDVVMPHQGAWIWVWMSKDPHFIIFSIFDKGYCREV